MAGRYNAGKHQHHLQAANQESLHTHILSSEIAVHIAAAVSDAQRALRLSRIAANLDRISALFPESLRYSSANSARASGLASLCYSSGTIFSFAIRLTSPFIELFINIEPINQLTGDIL